MKVLGALYLIFMLVTTAIGALLASEALVGVFSVSGGTSHPLLATVVHLGLVGVLFIQGMALHLRLPSAGMLGFVSLGIEGVLLFGLHLLK